MWDYRFSLENSVKLIDDQNETKLGAYMKDNFKFDIHLILI